MRTNMDNLSGKMILVVGLGKSGTAAAQTLIDMGAHVYVQDSRNEAEFDLNFISYLRGKGVGCFFAKQPYDMGMFDMILLSPGVSPELQFIEEGRAKGVEITGELEIAYRVARSAFIAITGTNGKTTTTTLVGEIFKAAAKKTHVVGNIGTAVITAAAKSEEDEYLVTECSSFQLETTKYFKPTVSAILNLTPDHLNRHHTMEAYGNAKSKIFENQSGDGYLIVNYDDKACFELSKKAKCRVVPFSRKEELGFGAFLRNGKIVIKADDAEYEICETDDLMIIGDHNVENALAAAAISFFAGIAPEIIGKALISFPGVEHRMEYCGQIDGVKYYNDSKGTNIDAAITALRAIKKDVILIAGGDSKGQVFDDFIKAFAGSVKKMILLGRDGHYIAEAADRNGFKNYVYCKDIPDCVRSAASMAQPGDTVLLSPACASWDMYDNFEQRGDHFKESVRGLDK